jgi:hypothetical protein
MGHQQAWENAAQVYAQVVERGAPEMDYRIYQVMTGLPDGHYLIFSTANNYAEYDEWMAASQAMWSQATPEEMETLQSFLANDVQSMLTHRFRVSPTMSYVSPETRAADPDFWR